MPTKVEGDYSKYPEALQESFPYIYGEYVRLHEDWDTFHHLYMANQLRSEKLGLAFGELFGRIGNLYEESMLIRISRLTDKDKTGKKTQQRNLTLWTILEQMEQWNLQKSRQVRLLIEEFASSTLGMKLMRHKQVAHLDYDTCVGKSLIETPTLKDIYDAVLILEKIIKEIIFQAIGAYSLRPHHMEITYKFENAAYKVAAIDELVSKSFIKSDVWTNHRV